MAEDLIQFTAIGQQLKNLEPEEKVYPLYLQRFNLRQIARHTGLTLDQVKDQIAGQSQAWRTLSEDLVRDLRGRDIATLEQDEAYLRQKAMEPGMNDLAYLQAALTIMKERAKLLKYEEVALQEAKEVQPVLLKKPEQLPPPIEEARLKLAEFQAGIEEKDPWANDREAVTIEP